MASWTPKTNGNVIDASHINALQTGKVDSDGKASPTFWNMTLSSLIAPGACTATLVAEAGNVTAGAHKYKITFVTVIGETELGAVSNEVTADGGHGKVNLSAIPRGATGSGVTSRKIYRTKAGNATDFYLLTTLGNNTATTYQDNTADGGLGADTAVYKANTTGGFLYLNGTIAGHVDWLSCRFGLNAGAHLTTGALTAFGRGAGHSNTSGHSTCVGDNAGYSCTTGKITAVGDTAGFYTTTVDATCLGYYAGYLNQTGYVVCVGQEAGRSNVSAHVVAVGYQALFNSASYPNVAVGYKAGFTATTAMILAIGYQAAYSATTGGEVLAIGYNAGFGVTTGIMLCLGYGAGNGAVTANRPVTDQYGILIGYNANRSVVSATALTNYIGIGYGVLIDKSNQVKIGNASITEINLHLTALPAAANNAAAAAAGISVGGLYRTDADPSVVCMRSA